MIKYVAAIFFILFQTQASIASQEGIASWYNDTRTASGERFNPNAMTCAHKKLPFGTLVTVTGANGRTIVCRVNDRGPYVKGRVIDLTHRAAKELGILQRGLMKVTLVTAI